MPAMVTFSLMASCGISRYWSYIQKLWMRVQAAYPGW